jgi:hypothetical protein
MQDMTPDHQDAFYVVDLSVVMHKLNKWRELMPRVKPFYAVKCNNDEAICRMLATAGWSINSTFFILTTLFPPITACLYIYISHPLQDMPICTR